MTGSSKNLRCEGNYWLHVRISIHFNKYFSPCHSSCTMRTTRNISCPVIQDSWTYFLWGVYYHLENFKHFHNSNLGKSKSVAVQSPIKLKCYPMSVGDKVGGFKMVHQATLQQIFQVLFALHKKFASAWPLNSPKYCGPFCAMTRLKTKLREKS